MKTFLKIILVLVMLIAAAAFAGIWYLKSNFPKVSAAPDLKIEPTAERLERGEYLVNHVTGCLHCHSSINLDNFAHPIIEGTEGKGGRLFDKNDGLPGKVYSRNITPSGIGNWTDGEVFRAMTTGVSKDGSPLFPLMPYMNFRKMEQEDLYSIIAYIRTLKPIDNKVPKTELDMPLNFLVYMMPNDPEPASLWNFTDSLERGKYLVNAASCFDCHTPLDDKGNPLPGRDFAGGVPFYLKDGSMVATSNITPDKVSGIGNWTRQMFVDKFKTYASENAKHIPISAGEFNTVMPYTSYAGLSEQELSDIYYYLQSLKPVSNPVKKFTAAK